MGGLDTSQALFSVVVMGVVISELVGPVPHDCHAAASR
jgi:hypothetical protein